MITETQVARFDSIALDCGATLSPVDIAYETYGELNASKTNAILVLHAFSGDAHAAGTDKESGELGWWDNMIGPGKGFDTDKYFVICSNVLSRLPRHFRARFRQSGHWLPLRHGVPAGHHPGHGPAAKNADRAPRHSSVFWPSPADPWERCKRSNGRWLIPMPWPPPSPSPAPLDTAPQQIAFNEVGRQAIMADPDWNEGNYYGKHPPARGLAVARMVGHITYMSDASMREKFGRRLRDQNQFEVESYLRYRGTQFVDRFDANSYLYITKAMDYYDLSADRHSLSVAFENVKARFLVISFTSDWLYPSYQSLEVVRALRGRNCDVAYCELPSTYGHDAFLVTVAEQSELIRGFLASTFRERG